MPSSFLLKKIFPPQRKGPTAQEPQEDTDHGRQYEGKQDDHAIEAKDIAKKEVVQATEGVTQELHQLEISDGTDEADEPHVKDAPMPPAVVEK